MLQRCSRDNFPDNECASSCSQVVEENSPIYHTDQIWITAKMSVRLSQKLVREATVKSGVTLSDIKELAAEAGTRVHKSKIFMSLRKPEIFFFKTNIKPFR